MTIEYAKERFIIRYNNAIESYFSYPGKGEGHRAILYVLNEYERILEEEFGMSHEEVKAIYDKHYADYYGNQNITGEKQ